MRKIIVTILIFFCFKANAQVNWTNVFGKQRFAQGFGIPVVDTSLLKGANDTACLVLMRGDSNLYFRYKGNYRKLSIGGGAQDLQSVLTNGHVAYNDIDLLSPTNPANEFYISPNNNGGMAFLGMKDSLDRYVELLTNDPRIFFQTKGRQQNLIYTDSAQGNIYLPYQDGQTDTLATLNDIRLSNPNLQGVLDNGNTANSSMTLNAPSVSSIEIDPNQNHIQIHDLASSQYTIYESGKISILKSNGYLQQLIFPTQTANRNLYIPIQTNTNDTIATLANVRASSTTIDTTSLSSRIDLRVKYTDTATMLTNYVNAANYGLTKSGHILSVDTSKISTLYQTNLKLNITDTTNKWVNSVTGLNDSTIRVVKGITTTDIIIRPTTTVTNATRLITTVYNKSGATITKGSVVYIDGAQSSNLPSIALAKANIEETSAYTYGLVETDIANNSQGTVIQNGTITNLNLPTSSYTDGQTLYLSPTIAGGYTTTKPLAPYHYVAIGTITRAHPNFGTIQIAIRNGFQLDEMSDVQIAAVPIDSTILQFSRVDSLWHAVNPTTAMGNRFVKTSDSAAMLLPYLRKADTTTLSNRINLKLNISDTASMLSPYARTTTLSGYLQKSDSATYQTKYRSDTARTNIYAGISSKQNTITLTTTGTTGAATFSSNTLNIPNYSNNDDYFTQACQLLGSTIKGFNLSIPRGSAMLTQTATLTNQNVRFFAYYLPNAQTITGVKWFQNTIGSYTANNYNGVGLYTYSGGTMTLVASSTNDGNIWQTASSGTMGSKAFSSTYSAAAGIYYIALLYCASAATTAPALAAPPSNVTATSANFDFTNSAKFFGQVAGQTTLPSTQASSGLATNTASVGIWLY